MRKILKKTAILLAIFVFAAAGYFVWSFVKQDDDSALYTAIEDADLPVVYMEMFGQRMNCLY
ncbi:hypothetical protein AAER49_01155, partial [Acinetobacter baumannii]|uniref:hypothetical protein n=1 Tax=Acinetobacter baumannii TaxID=470 RepID=UPI0031F38DED